MRLPRSIEVNLGLGKERRFFYQRSKGSHTYEASMHGLHLTFSDMSAFLEAAEKAFLAEFEKIEHTNVSAGVEWDGCCDECVDATAVVTFTVRVKGLKPEKEEEE